MSARFLLAASLLALCAAPAFAQWREAAPLDVSVHGATAVEEGGLVYLGGGAGLLASRDAFSAYDPAADAWLPLESLPVALDGHAMAALDGRIYVAGGASRHAPLPRAERNGLGDFGVAEPTSGPSARLWIYDIAADHWSEGPSMPRAREDFSLTALGGRLYATGAGRLVAFDPAEGVWSDLGPEPAPSRTAAGAALDGKLYLIGGAERGEGGAESAAVDASVARLGARVDIYDPATGLWSRGPDLPGPRYGHLAVTSGGRLHVIGGRDADGDTLGDHYVLEGGAWRPADPLPAPRAGAAGAALPGGGVIIAGGGFAGGFFAAFTAVDSTDIYQGDD